MPEISKPEKNYPALIKKNLIKILYWFAVFEFVFWLHSQNLYDSDEGVVLSAVWGMLNGKKLYFDIFAFVPPGAFYFYFFIFKIFGVYYYSAKIASVIIFIAGIIGAYKIANLIYKNKLNYALPFLIAFSSAYWPIISYHTLNFSLIVWAIYFYLLGLKNKNYKVIITSGILTGLAIITVQTKGAVIFVVLALFLTGLYIKEKEKNWLKLLFYYSIFSLLPVCLIFLKWPPVLLFENLFIFPFFNYTETNFVPYYLLSVFLVLLLFIAYLLRRENKLVWLLVFTGFFLLLSTASLANINHISFVLFPLFILFPVAIDRIKNSGLSAKIALIYISIFAFYLIYYFSFYYVYTFLIKQSPVSIAAIRKYVSKNCTDSPYIYAGPFLPNFYFELKKINPTPYNFLITDQNTKEQFDIAGKYLEKNPPGCVMLNYKIVKKYKYNIFNPVDNFILKNYHLALKKGNVLVYKKNTID